MFLSEIEKEILEKVSAAAADSQIEAYAVGGFVRDKLLERPVQDIDFVCIGNGLAFAKKAACYLDPNIKVNTFENFGTAQFVYKNYDLEFVGARKESYRNESRKPVVENGNLSDDQNRRDFTINAMGFSLQKENFGVIIDPFNAKKDLAEKIIRTPLQAEQTYSDDPLRMMRAIRFASQLNFRIEEKSFEAIKSQAERIKIISTERITSELNKIMLSPKPSIGFYLLQKSNLLQYIFPQLLELAGAEYIDGKGHKDNFHHTLEVLDNIAKDSDLLWLRWAALLHDIAKPATKKFEEGHGWTFHGHEWLGGKMVPKIFKQLKLPLNEPMRYVQKLVQLHLRPIALTKENITDSAVRRLLFDAGEDIDDLMLLCKADITSKNPNKVKRFRENFNLVSQRLVEVEEKDKIRNWQPPITGEIIMNTFNLSPSKLVGELKDKVREAILDGEIENNYEQAFQYLIKEAALLKIFPVEKN